MVAPSYALAFAYTFGDVADKAYLQYVQDNWRVTWTCFVQGFDALVWQTLASVAIPGYLINRTVFAATWALNRAMPQQVKIGPVPVKFIPVAVGLSTIPFIVEPIDHSTTFMMDKTLRKLY